MPVIRSEASTDDLLDAVAQLPTEQLTAFIQRAATLRAERVAGHLTHDEATLLQTIGRSLPPADRRRYETLLAMREAEVLTPAEHDELIRLSDEVEQINAERVEAIVALSHRRGISLADAMRSLGLQPADDGE